MALEAAIALGTDPKLCALYEAGIFKEDAGWFAEKGGITRETQRSMEAKALDAVLPEAMEETGALSHNRVIVNVFYGRFHS